MKGEFTRDFVQLGLITLTYQLTASLLQPLIGLYTDRHPKPFAAPIGMVFTMLGLILLAFAHHYETVLAAAALIGTGSSVWYRHQHHTMASHLRSKAPNVRPPRVVLGAIAVLLILVFSKYFYLASLSSLYTFYLMQKFHVVPQAAQLYLFTFLFASAARP